jgi:hypothetical protein
MRHVVMIESSLAAPSDAPQAQSGNDLRPPSFTNIADGQERSRALYLRNIQSAHERAVHKLPPGKRPADPSQ